MVHQRRQYRAFPKEVSHSLHLLSTIGTNDGGQINDGNQPKNYSRRPLLPATRTTLAAILACFGFLLSSLLSSLLPWEPRRYAHQRNLPDDPVLPRMPTVTILPPGHRSPRLGEPDYGGLNRTSGDDDDDLRYIIERRDLLKSIDGPVNDMYLTYEELMVEHPRCRLNNWERRVHGNCNTFHEHALERSSSRDSPVKVQYLASGSYRDAWLVQEHGLKEHGFIWKNMIFTEDPKLDFNHKRFREMQVDAIVMDQLTSSPRIPDIYGHCGTSLITERLVDTVVSDMLGGGSGYPKEDEGDDPKDAISPHNNLTLTEKLDMAISFSESLADLHGYVGGSMMHGDFHSPQWLRSMDGVIKLNDFNKAQIFQFDTEAGDYCPVRRCFHGSYRAPEDNQCVENGTEASDVFALGNNFYMILTGLWPHYNWDKERSVLYSKIADGTRRSFVDVRYRNRSDVESTLIRLMEAAWKQDPRYRASVFDVLKELYALRDRQNTGT
jgi:hypothetical protein